MSNTSTAMSYADAVMWIACDVDWLRDTCCDFDEKRADSAREGAVYAVSRIFGKLTEDVWDDVRSAEIGEFDEANVDVYITSKDGILLAEANGRVFWETADVAAKLGFGEHYTVGRFADGYELADALSFYAE